MLAGDTASNAFDAIKALPPSPAQESDIQADGLMVTRLETVFAPSASVGEVNSVLRASSATIVCMLENTPMVTLRVQRLSGRASVDSLITVLKGSGAFSFAFPSYAPQVESSVPVRTRTPAGLGLPGGAANNEIEHLIPMKMPAAWNVKELIPSASKVTVVVPDEYLQLAAHPEIPEQQFVAGGNSSSSQLKNEWVGNHGFHICGIIGARFDSLKATGIHPSGPDHLTIQSMPVGGFTWTDIAANTALQIGQRLPQSGKYVLNTSLGYNDTGFVMYPKVYRAWLMMDWRAWTAKSQDRFLQVSSAGNDGQGSGDSKLAAFASPFCSAARFASVRDMLVGVPLSASDSANLDQHVAKILSIVPEAAGPLHNIVIVGNNQGDGSEDPSSSMNPDVRCVGQLVYSTCVKSDPGFVSGLALYCDGSDGWYSGTSMAAPQVAGLAAYLWGISPNLSVSSIRDIIVRSDLNNQVDGYAAVQALDLSLSEAPVRMRLLDVADANDEEAPDGKFDEHDLAMFLAKFHSFENQRGDSSGAPDCSRYDLNGDGKTGDSTLKDGIFDLDVTLPQSFGTAEEQICGATHSFDETHLSDYDIVQYYAYSQLYTGDTLQRDSLLGCNSNPAIDFTFDSDLQGWSTGIGSCCAFNQVYWEETDLPGFGGIAVMDGSDASTPDTFPNSWIFHTIVLPSGTTTLKFDTSPHDLAGSNGALRVRLVSGGVSHTLLDWETLVATGDSLVFVPREANISAFAGQSVTLYFEQRDSGGRNNQQRYVDNIRIQ